MAPHKLLVLSNPVEGREDEYLCQLPSVISAQRFEPAAGLPGNDSAGWVFSPVSDVVTG